MIRGYGFLCDLRTIISNFIYNIKYNNIILSLKLGISVKSGFRSSKSEIKQMISSKNELKFVHIQLDDWI